MKKFILAAVLLLMAAIAGCAGTPPENNPVPEPGPVGNLPESIIVADAAMYRGTIIDIRQDADGLTVTLEQARGTNFGSVQPMDVVIADDIVMSGFESLAELREGDYLEVFYGSIVRGGTSRAITARLLPPADVVIFNGILEEIIVQDGQTGHMLVNSMNGGGQHLFHFSPEFTQFYLNFDGLQPGDELNIFHSGVSTRSIPPQSSALEVRFYYAR